MTQPPPYLRPCDPNARSFPLEWREAYFRIHFDKIKGGYVCPDCNNVFSGPKGFKMLQGDHIKPRRMDGLTIWENLILRCRSCNNKKGGDIIIIVKKRSKTIIK